MLLEANDLELGDERGRNGRKDKNLCGRRKSRKIYRNFDTTDS